MIRFLISHYPYVAPVTFLLFVLLTLITLGRHPHNKYHFLPIMNLIRLIQGKRREFDYSRHTFSHVAVTDKFLRIFLSVDFAIAGLCSFLLFSGLHRDLLGNSQMVLYTLYVLTALFSLFTGFSVSKPKIHVIFATGFAATLFIVLLMFSIQIIFLDLFVGLFSLIPFVISLLLFFYFGRKVKDKFSGRVEVYFVTLVYVWSIFLILAVRFV